MRRSKSFELGPRNKAAFRIDSAEDLSATSPTILLQAFVHEKDETREELLMQSHFFDDPNRFKVKTIQSANTVTWHLEYPQIWWTVIYINYSKLTGQSQCDGKYWGIIPKSLDLRSLSYRSFTWNNLAELREFSNLQLSWTLGPFPSFQWRKKRCAIGGRQIPWSIPRTGHNPVINSSWSIASW